MDFRKRCWAEIDLTALEENYRSIKKYLKDSTKILVVLKGDAYGHGDQQIGRFVEYLGADYLAVACYDEALSLRNAGCKREILIFGPTPVELARELVEYNMTQTLYDKEYADSLARQAAFCGITVKVHIKLETGLNRYGFRVDDHKELEYIAGLYSNPVFSCTGIYTHFSSADETSSESITFSEGQYKKFVAACDWLRRKGIKPGIRHCSASAALLRYIDWQMDMVRLGIVLYGILPSPACADIVPVKPVMSLYTYVAMVKEIPAGDYVGYGRAYRAAGPIKIATVPIGYGDGYVRHLGNRSRMLLHGQSAKVVGRVCMDNAMLDVSHIPDVQPGDLVTVVGGAGDESVTFDELAKLLGTIPHNLICNVTQRVPRLYAYKNRIMDVKAYASCRSKAM